MYVLRLTVLLCLMFSSAMAEENNLAETVHGVMAQGRKAGAKMGLPVNKHQEEGLKAAQQTAEKFYSPEFQERLQCEQKRIREEVFPEAIEELEEAEPASVKLDKEEKVYLFFSSSMPDETVHAYFEAVESADEPDLIMVMNGFAPGERENYLIRIARKDLGCRDHLQQEKPDICERYEIPITLRPSLFDKYKIAQVPALVYEKGEEAWKITGDAALDYLLERVNREARSSGLEELINALR